MGIRSAFSFGFKLCLVWLLGFSCISGTLLADDPEWGQPSDGLQMRMVAVSKDTDEQTPDFEKAVRTNEFHIADDVTFIVQIKNVTKEPIALQGVRYGKNVSEPWPGKSSQSKFGPLIFKARVYDQKGDLVEPPSRMAADEMAMLEASSGSAKTLGPDEVVTMLIKPLQWDSSLSTSIAAGAYEVEMTYQGTAEAAQAQIKKHWPDKSLGNVWRGAVKSPRQKIHIQKAYRDLRPKLAWGKPKNGLRVAAEYRLSDTRAEDPQEFIDRTFPIGSRINVRYHFQNTSSKPVELKSELWRQDDKILIVTDKGERKVSHPRYSGSARYKTWTLKPKQIVTVDAIPLSFPPAVEDPMFNSFGAEIKSGTGEYRIRHELPAFKISTGTSLLTMRDRESRDEPASFKATLVFRSQNKSVAKNGFVTARTQSGGKLLFDGELDGGALELEKWTGEALRVYARFPGSEENTFYDVKPKKGGITPIRLTDSNPIQMKLVDAKGKPVPDVDVRYFIRTGEDSRNYPYPVKGIEGPVWAKSDKNGEVSLDSVQSGYIYTFYIEPELLAPMFVSGISPGTDLEAVTLVAPFEVSGVIKCTPAQRKKFAAEWDQAVPMLLSDGSTSFEYAVSKKLPATRDGDQIRFRLTGLRPGKLRIIANFGKGNSVGHVYGRRKVGPTDELFEFELTGPRDDIVIQAKKD